LAIQLMISVTILIKGNHGETVSSNKISLKENYDIIIIIMLKSSIYSKYEMLFTLMLSKVNTCF